VRMSQPSPRDDYRLSAAILGTGSDGAIHGHVDMMSADRPISALRRAVQIYPAGSELIPTILPAVKEPTQ
jgi:hypothetical protein